jgi:predicted HAD superfamily hydrolase
MEKNIDINLISFGKENSISKESIMRISKICKEEDFRKALAVLRKKYIILSSSEHKGYWRPNTKQEYISFILEYTKRLKETEEVITLAQKEMKGMGL